MSVATNWRPAGLQPFHPERAGASRPRLAIALGPVCLVAVGRFWLESGPRRGGGGRQPARAAREGVICARRLRGPPAR
eukprot:11199940-Lingulodinium_polyedra.AAC.1